MTTPPDTAKPKVSSVKLMGTLGVAGMLAGTLIVSVFTQTQPRIIAYKAMVLAQSIQEVLKAPERYDTLYVVDGELTPDAPAGADLNTIEAVYRGHGPGGVIGYAIVAGEPGFQDIIRLIFGYDHNSGQLLGMKVLESKETPGLGDKIEKDMDFVGQWDGVATPVVGVKGGAAGNPNEIDMITGATISSRAVVRIINNALERLNPMIEAYEASQ